jgi:hypothetical protein
MVGSATVVAVGAGMQLGISGSGNNVVASNASVSIAAGAGVNLAGSGDTIVSGGQASIRLIGNDDTMKVTGGGTTIDLWGSRDQLSLSDGTVNLQGGAVASIKGSNNTVNTGVSQGDTAGNNALLQVAKANEVYVAGDDSRATSRATRTSSCSATAALRR